jgi:coenzyme PQQ precursor peptide PqqA
MAFVTRLRHQHLNQEARMKWTKPKFEIVDLCSEVTSYLFQR